MSRPDLDTSLLMLGDRPAEELAGVARRAEALGYRRLWHADERFFRDPWASLSLVASVTRTLEVGVCVTDPFVRHPALTARAFASVNDIAKGGATLGLGIGVSGFAELGINRERPLVAMREAIGLIRALLAGETVDIEGDVVSFRNGRLDVETRPGARIVVATNGPKMLRLAGELADGVIVQGLASETMVSSVRALVAEGAERAGRDPSRIRLVARVDACIAADASDARDRMRAGLVRHLRTHHPRYHSFELAGLDVPARLREAVADIRYGHGNEAAAALERQVPDEYIDRLCLAGSLGAVTDQVRRLRDAGLHEIMVFPVAPGGATRMDVVEEFARAVSGRSRDDHAQEAP